MRREELVKGAEYLANVVNNLKLIELVEVALGPPRPNPKQFDKRN
jgi:hypothetical protein